jgi:hypothetical protein
VNPDNVTNTEGLEKEYLLTIFLAPIHLDFKSSDEKLNEKTKQLVKDVQEALLRLHSRSLIRAINREQILHRAMDLLEDGEDTVGLCLACGEYHDGIEPDARGYTCEACGADKVYGLEEIVLKEIEQSWKK